MEITNVIKLFIEKVASKALSETAEMDDKITKEIYLEEYTSQIRDNDYLHLAAYAKSKNFKLPKEFGLDNLSSDEIYNMISYK